MELRTKVVSLETGGRRRGPGKGGTDGSMQRQATDKLNSKQHTCAVFMYSLTLLFTEKLAMPLTQNEIQTPFHGLQYAT